MVTAPQRSSTFLNVPHRSSSFRVAIPALLSEAYSLCSGIEDGTSRIQLLAVRPYEYPLAHFSPE
jgi:hypothetical protein